ncbi:MAG: hypothetical protein H6510_16500 [Acidobacteria bacterium]|nr:hypothetical protein [Acidobacteriota bacterium]
MHLLASKRFQDLISANLLVGIKFLEIIEYEVGIKGKKGKRFLKAVMGMGYKGIYAVGSGGSIAKTSGVFLRKKCEICGFKEHSLALNGIHIDETQWDGSDFFQIEELPGPTFMSDRAKCILEGGGLSNFAPIRTEDYKVPFREHLIKRYRDEEFGAFLQP